MVVPQPNMPFIQKMRNYSSTPFPKAKVLLETTGANLVDDTNYRSLMAERALPYENQTQQIDPEAYIDMQRAFVDALKSKADKTALK
jgi:hypothetical protein